jgi:GNAT superfamily N-acetyltransferase
MNDIDGLTFIDNGVTAELLSRFRQSVHWSDKPLHQFKKALENSLFSVAAVCDGKTVGIGRLIGDGVTDWYLKDIIIHPDYQGKGIGRALMEYLLRHITDNSLPETTVTISLLAAKGKEPFYEKLGFRVRPNDHEGAGMLQYLKID